MLRRPTTRPREAKPFTRIVHLIDGTYELFRHFYGLRRFTKGKDRPYGAVVGVLQTLLQLLEEGDRVKAVATASPSCGGHAMRAARTSASPPIT